MDVSTSIRTVKLINLQFSFSNSAVVPSGLPRRPLETSSERYARTDRTPTGAHVIQFVEDVSLCDLADDLQQNEFELTDAFSQRRGVTRAFEMVRFVFTITPPGTRDTKTFHQSLQMMCQQALWRVGVWLNPFFVEGGRQAPGQHAISISCNSRKPLYDNTGRPVKIWRKDANGQRLGAAPIAIKAKYALRFDQHDGFQISKGE